MPELAEVEFYRKEWLPGIGETLEEVLTHPMARIYRDCPAVAVERHLPGQSLKAAMAHGKQMLFQFSGGNWLGIHLGMTGRLSCSIPGLEPEKHDHLVLRSGKRTLVFSDPRMFGKLTFDRSSSTPDWWSQLPPQILDPGFTRDRIRVAFGRFGRSPLKSVLLDQRYFPGIGNWMADEICWRCRILPARRCQDLTDSEVDRIWKVCREVARRALKVIGDGWRTPPDSWLFNHRWKDGGFCPRKDCKVPLVRLSLRGRTTCWCPVCQTA